MHLDVSIILRPLRMLTSFAIVRSGRRPQLRHLLLVHIQTKHEEAEAETRYKQHAAHVSLTSSRGSVVKSTEDLLYGNASR